MPKTITCRVLSTGMLKDLSSSLIGSDDADKFNASQSSFEVTHGLSGGNVNFPSDAKRSSSLILAGLHACGDLSVTMLRYACSSSILCTSPSSAWSITKYTLSSKIIISVGRLWSAKKLKQ